MPDKNQSNKNECKKTHLDLEQQFINWLDGESLNPDLEKDEQWLKRVQTANFIAHQAENSSSQKVPDWDRGATFVSDKNPWWQYKGLPALSMALSIFAVALVLFKVELVVKPEGVLLTFSGSEHINQEEKVLSMVDQRLKEFAAEQQVVLTNYAVDIQVKQQDNNLQLASYIMGASRQERKEDITDFIQFFNEQRKDEKLDQKIKFKELEQTIKDQNKYQKINQRKDQNQLGINQKDLNVPPVNWMSEE